ncbi:MAG: dTMP kinase [Spirochaetes bacterium]|nr:dTMP kinase [Spirochaetota bacterium]
MKHNFPGVLIAVEGIDGSGKSTQIYLLKKWLESEAYSVFLTEWNSSNLVKDTIKRGKKENLLTPLTFSILHATDFADRYIHLILPPLKAGMIVLCDRYYYTALARDTARGVPFDWVRDVYSFAFDPDITFYFRVDVETSLKRLKSSKRKIKFHEAGMDLNISDDINESFKIFQNKVIDEYDKMTQIYNFEVLDAKNDINSQQQKVRQIVREKILNNYIPKNYLKRKLKYVK